MMMPYGWTANCGPGFVPNITCRLPSYVITSGPYALPTSVGVLLNKFILHN